MNILNKLNQADRKKIENRLKKKYKGYNEYLIECDKMMDNCDNKDEKLILWHYYLQICAEINGMKSVMDIFGIDYSDWGGKI